MVSYLLKSYKHRTMFLSSDLLGKKIRGVSLVKESDCL